MLDIFSVTIHKLQIFYVEIKMRLQKQFYSMQLTSNVWLLEPEV